METKILTPSPETWLQACTHILQRKRSCRYKKKPDSCEK